MRGDKSFGCTHRFRCAGAIAELRTWEININNLEERVLRVIVFAKQIQDPYDTTLLAQLAGTYRANEVLLNFVMTNAQQST